MTWTATPTRWSNGFFENLFAYEWELTESPAGAKQWQAKDPGAEGTIPDAVTTARSPARADDAPRPTWRSSSTRSTSEISRRFHEHPDEFADAFARAWYKLLHRDMGPVARYLGPWVPAPQLWQDPVPAVDHELVDDADIAALKRTILDVRRADSAACRDRVVGRGVASAAPTCAAGRTGRASASSRRRTGPWAGARRAGAGARGARADPAGVQRRTVRRQEGLARRPDRSSQAAPPSSDERPRAAATTSRSRSPRAARTPRRSRRTSSHSRCWSRPSTGSETTSAPASRCRSSAVCSSVPTC